MKSSKHKRALRLVAIGPLPLFLLLLLLLHSELLLHGENWRRLAEEFRGGDSRDTRNPIPQTQKHSEITEKKLPTLPTPNHSEITEKKLPTLPNVLLVGAQKAGSTALANFIFHHHHVCKPMSVPGNKNVKEVHFFDLEDRYAQGPELYLKHFEHCAEDDTVVLDATPDYLPWPHRIRDTYEQIGSQYASDLKVIMILREPTSREFSWYNHMVVDSQQPDPPNYTNLVRVRKTGETLDFDEYVKRRVIQNIGKPKTSGSLYAKWLQQWINHFDRKQILILSYDEFTANPESVTQRVRTFLSLNKRPDGGPHVTQINTKGTTRPEMPCETQSRLSELFENHNTELYDLLETHEGPEMEQKPFPKFNKSPCQPSSEETSGAE